MTVPAPCSAEQLYSRATQLAGLTVGELARGLGFGLRNSSVHAKGSVGEVLERALGATAGSLDQPDFPHLGIELKTIPLDRLGRVRESTFVCTLSPGETHREEWSTSRVWRKLSQVLWIPIHVEPGLSVGQRTIGRPLLWRPSLEEQILLKNDWLFLVGQAASGGAASISAHFGEVLQLRPKAANSQVKQKLVDYRGNEVEIVPKGFYLRARFTEKVLWRLSDVSSNHVS